MGIFKAAGGSVGGVLADQWLEFYSCSAMPQDVLAQRGQKKISKNSSNTKGSENVISDGSTILVADNQCALVIEKGAIIAHYQTPGENVFHSEHTKSLFSKGGLKSVAKQSFERFGYGGEVPVYQIVMYLDLRERMNNAFSMDTIINIKDRNTDMRFDARLSLSGTFSFHITDPVTFYKNICGNRTGTVYVKEVQPQITAELEQELRIVLAEICEKGVSPTDIESSIDDIIDAATQRITEEWTTLRGFGITSLAISDLHLIKGDLETLQSVQKAKALTDPTLAAATLVGAQAQAVQDAAQNTSGGGGFFAVNTSKSANPFLEKKQSSLKLVRFPCGHYNTASAKFCEECGAKKEL